MYVHKDWPRDLIHKATGKRQEWKRPEDVPPGWFTVDGEEVNPEDAITICDPSTVAEVKADASEQALRNLRGRGSDAKPRGKGRGRGHTEPDGGDAGVSDVESPGGLGDG